MKTTRNKRHNTEQSRAQNVLEHNGVHSQQNSKLRNLQRHSAHWEQPLILLKYEMNKVYDNRKQENPIKYESTLKFEVNR